MSNATIDTTTVAGCRSAEADAFNRAADLLEAAAKGGADLIKQALQFNQLLWSLVLADITEADNKLPLELKANIVSLSMFVEGLGEKFAKGEKIDLNALVNINRNLAQGLGA